MNPTTLNALLPALPDRPSVLRLTGAGAAAAAARWAAEYATVERAHLQDPLPGGRGAVWLGDAPGARSLGDAWIAESALLERPFRFVLTGRALDAGHPSIGTTHAVDEPGEALPDDGLAIRIPTGDDPTLVDDLERATCAGDTRLSLALVDLLERLDPRRAAAWRWVELARLAAIGRREEAAERAFTFAASGHRGSLFAELAWSKARSHQPVESADLAWEALSDDSLPPRVHADLRYLLRLLEDGFGSPDVRPQTPFRVSIALALWARRHPECRAELDARDDLRSRQFRVAVDGREDPEAWLTIGSVHDAARAVGNQRGPSWATVLFEDNGADRAWFDTLDQLLDAGDLAGAKDMLAVQRDRFHDRQTFGGVLWALYWGRVAAGTGDAAETTWARARLGRIGPRLLPMERAVRAIPRDEEGPDPWCVGHWLEALIGFLPEIRDRIEARASLLPETRIPLGPYALQSTIARGGMGTVWRAEHVLTGRPVAIKVMRPLDEAGWEAFRREVDLACRFDHPCIATVLDQLEGEQTTAIASRGAITAGRPLLVMELVDHGSLADHQGMLPWDDLRDILLALLDALAYVHAHGVVHRDVKPENVLVTSDHRLRLCDFGIAGIDDRIAGTPSFMAPEQFQRSDVGPRADLYALGCTAWALATGLPPFLGSPQDLARAHAEASLPPFEPFHPVPDGFLGWLHRCLEKVPRQRFSSAAAAADALMTLGDVSPAHDARQPPGSTDHVPSRREPTYRLPTLLDLPPEPANIHRTATLRTLHDVFVPRMDPRPRLPTSRLLDTGDPPIHWQERAQEALWTALMRVAGGRSQRVHLVAAPSQGRRSLIGWLRRKGRIAGLDIHDVPTPRRVSVVDATGTDPSDWADSAHEPWLLIWRDDPGSADGIRRVELARLTPLQTWWLLDRRVLLTSRAAALAATRSLGYPSLGLALLSAWLEDPGTRMTAGGLAPMRPPPEVSEAGRAWWADRWSGWDPAGRERAIQACIHFPWFPADDDGDVSGLASVAFQLNGTWCLSPDLRANLLADLTPGERADLHRRVAPSLLDGPRRRVHELLGDPRPERVVRLAEALASHRSRTQDALWLAVLRRFRTRFLVRHPLVEAMDLVASAPVDDLPGHCEAPGVHGALAFVRWVALGRPLDPGLRALHERRLQEHLAGGHLDGPHANVVKAFALLDAAAGHANPLRWLDAALQVGGDPTAEDIVRWTRIRLADETDPGLLASFGETAIRARVASDLVSARMRRGDFAAAAALLEASHGHKSLVEDYNRVLCALYTGSHDDARAHAHAVLPTVHMQGHRLASHGLLQMVLLMEMDREGQVWEDAAARCDPVRDPMLADLLERELADRPPSARRDRLLGMIHAGRTSG
jgi:serine/threonine protein kinase